MIFSNLFCLFNASIAIAIPLLIIIISFRYNKKMKINKAYRRKYKFIFSEIKADKQPEHLYFVLFIFRRYILIISLIAFPKKYFLQIWLTFITQTVFFGFIMHS